MQKFIKAIAAIILTVALICAAGCQKDPKIYNVNVSASPVVGGIVTGGGNYEEGQSCTVTATANSEYSFEKWTENGNVVSTNANYTFSVTGNRSLEAHFIQSYTISVAAEPANGGIVMGGGNYHYGDECTVKAIANEGYLFNNWTEDGEIVSTDATYAFSVNTIRSLVAVFVPSCVVNTITIPFDGGMVEGGGVYPEGGYCTLTASASHGYTFTYWTVDGNVVSALPVYTFNVTSDIDLVANFAVPSASSYIDLGLPSGTLWATWNVGAASPEGYGDYFAWGETQPKNDIYYWSTYQCCNGSYTTLTKYCNNSSYGNNGFTDNLTTLQLSDDAARTNWGGDWRMPTGAEWYELFRNTTVTWTTQNGVYGGKFTASNGNILFLPAAGYRLDVMLFYGAASDGYYWSSSLNTNAPDEAWGFNFRSGVFYRGSRCLGHSVRAVLPASKN